MDRSVGAQDKEPNNMGNIENQLVAHSKEVRGETEPNARRKEYHAHHSPSKRTRERRAR
jgi:hypothetical protein